MKSLYDALDAAWSATGTTAKIVHMSDALTYFMRARWLLHEYIRDRNVDLGVAMRVLDHVASEVRRSPPVQCGERDAYAYALWTSLDIYNDVDTYSGRQAVSILGTLAGLGHEEDARAVFAAADGVNGGVVRAALDAQRPRMALAWPKKRRRGDEGCPEDATGYAEERMQSACAPYAGPKCSWPLATALEVHPSTASAVVVQALVKTSRWRTSPLLAKVARACPQLFAEENVIRNLLRGADLARLAVATHALAVVDKRLLNRLDVGAALVELADLTLPRDPPCTYLKRERTSTLTRKATTRKRVFRLIREIEAPQHCDWERDLGRAMRG
jgi:hypothetical protein